MKNTQKIEDLIRELPKDFQQAEGMLKEKIMPLIADCERHIQEHYLKQIKKRTGTNMKAVHELFHESISLLEQEEDDEMLVLDSEAMEKARELATDPQLFKNLVQAVEELGLVGETQNIGVSLVTLNSRLNPAKETLLAMIGGPPGCGKSEILNKALELYPSNAYFMITSASSKAISGMGEHLKNKALIFAEGYNLEKDSELTEHVRSLQSEGHIKYARQEKVAGKYVTTIDHVSGPMSLVTTTIKDSLEGQLSDRMFTIHPNTSEKQVQEILKHTAYAAAGKKKTLDPETIQAWKAFHEYLEPYDVLIPFAGEIYSNMETSGLPKKANRAFSRVLYAIKSVTILHQEQRELSADNKLVAEISDYALVYQLFKETFLESLGDYQRLSDEKLKVLEQQGPMTPGKLARAVEVTKPTLSDWIKRNISAETIFWSNGLGEPFDSEIGLTRAQKKGTAHLKVAKGPALPTPFEITRDNRWAKGGELYELYNLGLEDDQPIQLPALDILSNADAA